MSHCSVIALPQTKLKYIQYSISYILPCFSLNCFEKLTQFLRFIFCQSNRPPPSRLFMFLCLWYCLCFVFCLFYFGSCFGFCLLVLVVVLVFVFWLRFFSWSNGLPPSPICILYCKRQVTAASATLRKHPPAIILIF